MRVNFTTIAVTIGVLLCFTYSTVNAVYNGSPATPAEGYACMAIKRVTPDPKGPFLACSCALITHNLNPSSAQYQRLILTAAHCPSTARDVYGIQDSIWEISFLNKPIVNRTLQSPSYIGSAYYTATVTKQNTLIHGDFALIVLDGALPTDITPLFFDLNTDVGFIDTYATGNNKRVTTLNTTGYGIEYWETAQNGGIGPYPFDSNRFDKETVTLGINSVRPALINAGMNLANGDQTLCNGDSGGVAVAKHPTQNRILPVGVVSSGDRMCRSLNTYARIDTKDYKAFAQSVLTLRDLN